VLENKPTRNRANVSPDRRWRAQAMALYSGHCPQADRTTARGRARLRPRHARLFRCDGYPQKDEIAAKQLWLLKQHWTGKLKITDVREMFAQMRDQV
jgi:hypothetical protein